MCPELTKAYFFRGLSYFEIGELDKAIADLSEVIETEYPNTIDYYGVLGTQGDESERAYLPRGLIYRRKGEHEKAIADFSKLIEIGACELHEVYFYRGLEYAANRDDIKAIADFSKAIDIKDTFAEAYSARSAAYQRIGEDKKSARDESAYQRLINTEKPED